MLKQRERRLGTVIGKLPTLMSSSSRFKCMNYYDLTAITKQGRSLLKMQFIYHLVLVWRTKAKDEVNNEVRYCRLRISPAHNHEGIVMFEIRGRNRSRV